MTTFKRLLLKALFIGGLVTTILVGGVASYLVPQLPEAAEIRNIDLQIPLRVYTADNRLIGEFGEKRRTPIAHDDVPVLFIKAILAAEDDGFFEHSGIDVKGLIRAALELATTGSIQSGGSTITMQVAKNYFLSFEQTFSRKFTEILLAFELENQFSKKEILELYVNKIYLGKRAYGIQAAAAIYYGKTINELNLAQLAMIASIPKAPSKYNPIASPDRAINRRDWILKRMRKLGYIDNAQLETALAQPVTASFHGSIVEVDAPYIAEMVRRDLILRYGRTVYTGGYKVYTTIDSEAQLQGQQALRQGLLAYDRRHGYRGAEAQLDVVYDGSDMPRWLQRLQATPTIAGMRAAVVTTVAEQSADIVFADGETASLNWDDLKTVRRYVNENRRTAAATSADSLLAVGELIRVEETRPDHWALTQIPAVQGALVALNPNSGALTTLVGGYNFSLSKFNRATQAKRQPGSNFKPFFYAYAMERGFTPASLINDAPIVFKDWRPDNYSDEFYGPTPLRKALYLSRNVVSIRLMQALGVNNAARYVERFGFNSNELPRSLSLALGTQTVTPLQIATAYARLANGGYKVEPYWIDRIVDGDDVEVFRAQPKLAACNNCDAEIDLQAAEPDEQQHTAAQQAERIADERTILIGGLHSLLDNLFAFQSQFSFPCGDVGVEYVLSTPLRVVRGDLMGRPVCRGRRPVSHEERILVAEGSS